MSARSQVGHSARLGAVSLVSLAVPMSQVSAIDEARRADGAPAAADRSVAMQLPFEMQPDYFHSLPIAGHVVTPDEVALRVMTNPRLRVTAVLPYSGKGTANPIHQSGAADTRADPLITTSSVRGGDRPPNP